MWRGVLLVMVACGRFHFDPIGGVEGGDGGTTVDGNDAGNTPPDGVAPIAGDTCATAIAITVGMGRPMESITNAANDHNGLFCGNGPEIVYRMTLPAASMVTFDLLAEFGGSFWIAQPCPPVSGSCQSFSSNAPYSRALSLAAGTHFLVIDKTSGAGTAFSIAVQ